MPLYDSKSLSKISTPRNPAAAIASSFSLRPPLRQTVAIDVFMTLSSDFPAPDQLFRERRIARGERLGESAMQPRDVGLDAGKSPERFDRLVHAHPAAVHHPRAFRGGGLDEGRFDRRVDDVGSPMRRLQRGNRHRVAGKTAHADLRRVDDTVGRRDVTFEIAARRGSATRRNALPDRP